MFNYHKQRPVLISDYKLVQIKNTFKVQKKYCRK